VVPISVLGEDEGVRQTCANFHEDDEEFWGWEKQLCGAHGMMFGGVKAQTTMRDAIRLIGRLFRTGARSREVLRWLRNALQEPPWYLLPCPAQTEPPLTYVSPPCSNVSCFLRYQMTLLELFGTNVCLVFASSLT
jgi:hypothetical protein